MRFMTNPLLEHQAKQMTVDVDLAFHVSTAGL
jgi:hypothetical protein